jgi:ankyrin repeat protein
MRLHNKTIDEIFAELLRICRAKEIVLTMIPWPESMIKTGRKRSVLIKCSCGSATLSGPSRWKKFRQALAIEPGDAAIDGEAIPDADVLISVCGGLVTIDRDSDVIRLVHYTTQEYLEDKHEQYFPKAHSEISKTCLIYLSMETFAAPLSNNYLVAKKQIESTLKENILLNDVSCFWAEHLGGDPEHDNKNHVLNLFRQPLNTCWLINVWLFLDDGFWLRDEKSHGLWIASRLGLEYICQVLIQAGADVNLTSTWGRMALHAAAEGGYYRIVTLLIEAGATIDATDTAGRTAMHYAAKAGHNHVVKLLLENGADKEPISDAVMTPLHYAARKGNEEVVITLIENDASIHATDDDGWTALHLAQGRGRSNIIKILLKNGADLNARTPNGDTALQIAAYCGDVDTVRMLVIEGAKIDMKDKLGRTPLSKALCWGRSNIVRLILEAGADPNAKDDTGESLLHLNTHIQYRSYDEKRAIHELLLQYGAVPEPHLPSTFDGWSIESDTEHLVGQ